MSAAFDTIEWIMIALMITIFSYFSYSLVLYRQKVERWKWDKLTILSFVFILFTLVLKIIFKAAAMILVAFEGMLIYDYFQNRKD